MTISGHLNIGTSDHPKCCTNHVLRWSRRVQCCAMSLEKHRDLRRRTQDFGLRILKMSRALPRNREADVIARQVLRSGMSVAANYRAQVRAARKLSSSQSSGLSLKKLMRRYFGLRCWARAGSYDLRGWKLCLKRQTNSSQFLEPHGELHEIIKIEANSLIATSRPMYPIDRILPSTQMARCTADQMVRFLDGSLLSAA